MVDKNYAQVFGLDNQIDRSIYFRLQEVLSIKHVCAQDSDSFKLKNRLSSGQDTVQMVMHTRKLAIYIWRIRPETVYSEGGIDNLRNNKKQK